MNIIAAITENGLLSDLTIPISSFQVNIEEGQQKYIQVVVPGLHYAEQIADRADGSLTIYRQDAVGAMVTIASMPITFIRIDEGGNSKSITLQANS